MNDEILSDVWKYCELANTNNATPEQVALINTSISLLYEKFSVDRVDSTLYR